MGKDEREELCSDGVSRNIRRNVLGKLEKQNGRDNREQEWICGEVRDQEVSRTGTKYVEY